MGKGNRSKRRVPAAAQVVTQPEKTPRVGKDTENYSRACPTWSFALLDPVGAFGWTHFQRCDLDELLARFREWEKMTWAEILAVGGKQNHSIDVYKCSKDAKERLKFLGLGDHEQLMSLRVNSKARVIGVRDRDIFYILWWDPDHQVCPSTQKHT